MNAAALIVAIFALGVSLAAFVFEYISRRRQLFLTIYGTLLEADQQRGRRFVHQLAESGSAYDSLDESARDTVNHALSTLNVLGFLYHRRYISRRDALSLWGPATLRVRRSAHISGFLAYRDGLEGGRVWPFFRSFSDDAEKFNKQGPS
ncbi:hypothetical protein [Kribbella sp. C-35]|uniref:hypothetical protein n=1 Tax=Kribbella sp. C-35 TaxID=2789276 RepID=UPI003978415D